jgi:hypothetical protein
LLASVFPQAAACFENIEGDIQIPDHPLVKEVMRDVLQEAMDLEGLKNVIAAMHDGRIQCVAVDTTTPSAFAHELINANPNAFLDDAGLEERRARAVQMRGVVPDAVLGEAGRLSPEAIEEVRAEIWPDIRDEHELHDLLCALVAMPVETLAHEGCRDWDVFLTRLERTGRAVLVEVQSGLQKRAYFVAAERVAWVGVLWPEVEFPVEMLKFGGEVPCFSDILMKLLQGWLQMTGPVTSAAIAAQLGVETSAVWPQMLRLETTGTILRGVFEGKSGAEAIPDGDVEWCERRILQRIHKRTLHALRRQIEPVTPSVYMRYLLDWQHVGEMRQLTGEQGLLEALRGLEGSNDIAAARCGIRSAMAGRALFDGRGWMGPNFAACCFCGCEWRRPKTRGADEHGAGDFFCSRRGVVDGFVPGTATNSGSNAQCVAERAGEPGAFVSGHAGSDVCRGFDSHARGSGGRSASRAVGTGGGWPGERGWVRQPADADRSASEESVQRAGKDESGWP